MTTDKYNTFYCYILNLYYNVCRLGTYMYYKIKYIIRIISGIIYFFFFLYS